MDPDELALVALGEPLGALDESAADHLRQCPTCRGEIELLQHTVELAREAVQHRDTAPPPETVWSRIASDVGFGTQPGGAPPAPQPGPHRAEAPVTRLAGRRRWIRPAAALVAAAAVGVAGTLGVLRPWAPDREPATASSATLSAVPGGPVGVAGRAVVVRGPAGPELQVTATGLPLQPGYYEVWVFDGTDKMVALGVLGSRGTASLPLPPTLDLRAYPVVDVSEEAYDGDQRHSATSVLRGTLTN